MQRWPAAGRSDTGFSLLTAMDGILRHMTIGKMENNMETTIVYWVYIGIMENKMETTISS